MELVELMNDPEFGKSYVWCPGCSSKRNSLSSHTNKCLGMSLSEFRNQYPDYPTASEEVKKRRSEAMAKQWQDKEIRAKRTEHLTKIANDSWSDPEYRKKKSDIMKERHTDPEFTARMMAPIHEGRDAKWNDPEQKEEWLAKLRNSGFYDKSDPEVRKKISDNMKKLWSDDEYANRQIEAILGGTYTSTLSSPLHGRKCTYISKSGDSHKFLSFLELYYALYLDLQDINWISSKSLKPLSYHLPDGSLHRYTPDFYYDGVYYDTKGWLDPIANYKMEQASKENEVQVVVVTKDDIIKEFHQLNYNSLLWNVENNATVTFAQLIKLI
ncbi:endonuclease [Bacillus phage vB_BceM-HSE3]|nr:endonuclease [Bacillus phage vB_BceM-HSE3]